MKFFRNKQLLLLILAIAQGRTFFLELHKMQFPGISQTGNNIFFLYDFLRRGAFTPVVRTRITPNFPNYCLGKNYTVYFILY